MEFRKLKNLIILAAAAAAFASCDKNDLPETATQGEALQIAVEAQNFASQQGGEVQLRSSESGYTTAFTAGDRIGITVVQNGTTILEDNVPYQYSGTVWTPVVASNIVHKYTAGTITYLAHYPYSATMSGKRTAAEILAAFTPPTNQSTHDNYAASDLMTGAGTVSGTTLNVTLAHVMALMEVSLPPSVSNIGINLNGAVIQPYNFSNGVYRCIAAPAANVTAGGSYTIGGNSYFWQQTVNLEAGKYARVDVKHTGDGTATDPYCIYTVADMLKVGSNVDGWTLSANYLLMADLTLNNWATKDGVYGAFNGNGHTLNFTGTVTPYSRQ